MRYWAPLVAVAGVCGVIAGGTYGAVLWKRRILKQQAAVVVVEDEDDVDPADGNLNLICVEEEERAHGYRVALTWRDDEDDDEDDNTNHQQQQHQDDDNHSQSSSDASICIAPLEEEEEAEDLPRAPAAAADAAESEELCQFESSLRLCTRRALHKSKEDELRPNHPHHEGGGGGVRSIMEPSKQIEALDGTTAAAEARRGLRLCLCMVRCCLLFDLELNGSYYLAMNEFIYGLVSHGIV